MNINVLYWFLIHGNIIVGSLLFHQLTKTLWFVMFPLGAYFC